MATRKTQSPARSGVNIADLSPQDRVCIALDDRPLNVVAQSFGLTIPQVTRLRAIYKPLGHNRTGRPSTYTVEKAAEICRYFSEGITWKAACDAAGIPLQTANGWLDRYEEFRAARGRALVGWARSQEEQILQIADDLTIDPAHKPHMIKSRQWLMERQLEEYRRRTPEREAPQVTYLQLLQIANGHGSMSDLSPEPRQITQE